jgi:hypothetical protein
MSSKIGINKKRLTLAQGIREARGVDFLEKQIPGTSDNSIVRIALVISVNYYADKNLFFPPYSINAILDQDRDNINAKIYAFHPLLPIHQLALPQVGEEVYVLLFDQENSNKGFWISRVNQSDSFSSQSLNLLPTNDDDVPTENQKLGMGLTKDKISEKIDEEPNEGYETPTLRVKPGDVLTHGRSNTHIFNTFDTKNKSGIIDIVTEVKDPKKSFYEQEFSISEGSRMLLATKHNLDEDAIKEDLDLKFHADFNKSAEASKDEPFVLIKASQLRLLSDKGSDINHTVLAEKQAEWLTKMIELIVKLLEYLDTLNSKMTSHFHTTPSGPSGPLMAPELNALTQLTTDLNTLKSDIEAEKDTIIDHHSKNIGIN